MARYQLARIDAVTPVFIHGSNLGNKVDAKNKNAKMILDTVEGLIYIEYQGKRSCIPMVATNSFDFVDQPFIPEWDKKKEETQPESTHPHARRGKQAVAVEAVPVEMTEAERHRQEVRARSMNANKAAAVIQNDSLIQQARGQAMGFKSAQIENPTRPAVGLTGLEGKVKAMSHAQLKAQVALEAKDVKGTS